MKAFYVLLCVFAAVLCTYATSSRFWTIADVHLSGRYVAGSDPQTYCTQGTGVAGPNGYYDCDTPPETLFPSSLQFMNTKEPDSDFLVWLGDSPTRYNREPNHTQTDDMIWGDMRRVAKTIDTIMGKNSQTGAKRLIFPVIGNHDNNPSTECPAPEDNKTYYEKIADIWKIWLNDDQLATVKNGGYYTGMATSNIRIVALNTVLYYVDNEAIAKNHTTHDVGGQLAWLEKTLASAAAAGEKVLIIAHVAPNFNIVAPLWFPFFINEFVRVVKPYAEKTIIGYLYGHDHSDSLALITAPDASPEDAVGVSQLLPSVTPRMAVGAPNRDFTGGKNPAVRLYEYVDGRDGKLIDYIQFIGDLMKEKQTGVFSWEKSYSFREQYNATDLSFASLRKTIDRIRDNNSAWCSYFKFVSFYYFVFVSFYRHGFFFCLFYHRHFYADQKTDYAPILRRGYVCGMYCSDPVRLMNCISNPPFPDFNC